MVELLRKVYDRCDKKHLILYFSALVVLVVAEIFATQAIPHVREVFYGSLETRNTDSFTTGLVMFAALYGTFIISQGLKYGMALRTALLVRIGLSKVLLKAWISTDKDVSHIDNPDQRIAEDGRIATETFLKVGIEFIISAVLVIVLLIQAIQHPLIAFASVTYTLVVVLAATRFRKPMITRDIDLQHSEADYRRSLVKISLNQGDFTAKENFSRVVCKTYRRIKLLTGFNIFSAGQNNFSVFIPWLILAPGLFAGSITFGEFMAHTALFELIVVNSTIAVALYPDVTKTESAWIRIQTFYNSIKK